MKYTHIGEKHREITFGKRMSLLEGTYNSEFWQHEEDLYKLALEKFPEEEIQKLQNKVLALMLNEFHSDYLDYSAYLREGIHLTQIAGRNPAEEYNIACEEYYTNAAESFGERMREKLEILLGCESIADFPLNAPTRTYTYLLNDMGEEFKAKPILMGILSDDYEEEAKKAFDKKQTPPPESEPTEKKKGFFGRLFGKK